MLLKNSTSNAVDKNRILCQEEISHYYMSVVLPIATVPLTTADDACCAHALAQIHACCAMLSMHQAWLGQAEQSFWNSGTPTLDTILMQSHSCPLHTQ